MGVVTGARRVNGNWGIHTGRSAGCGPSNPAWQRGKTLRGAIMTLSVLVLQHELNDGPGYLGDALLRRGARLAVTRLDEGEALPDILEFDMLLVMGGVMNVYQEGKYPWLIEETHAVHQAVEAGKAVLGICLGGQL